MLEALEAKLRGIYPKKAPAWIAAFARWLMAHWPQVVAIILGFVASDGTPLPADGPHKDMVDSFAACHDCATGEPGLMRGPIFDPKIAAAFDDLEAWIIKEGISALDYGKKKVELAVSSFLP